MEESADVFKALSDKTRLRIMCLLKGHPEICVCEITDSLNEGQYKVSRHLRELKSAGLIREKKKGRWVFYSLSKPANRFHKLILEAISAVSEGVLGIDQERLRKRLSLRENGKCVVGMNSEEWRNISNQLRAGVR